MNTIQAIELIATNPEVRNGRPHLIGTTLTVADVAIVKVYHRKTADEIAAWFGLSLPQVYAALAYYYSHRDEMDDAIKAEIKRAEELAEKRPGGKDSLLPG